MALPDPLFTRIKNLYEKKAISLDEAKSLCVQLAHEKTLNYIKQGIPASEAVQKAIDDISGRENYGRLLA